MKVGVIDVLNVLPVLYGIFKKRVSLPGELVHGKVSELNRLLREGEIDISVISSFEYAQNPEQYYVFPDLSISCDGAVKSIYLFTKARLEDLQEGSEIKLTSDSLTSIHLVQYLLKEKNLIFDKKPKRHDGEVKIADDAIRAFYSDEYNFKYDLGSLWKKKTGLPFVFAVWAVRRDSFEKNKTASIKIYRQILRSKNEFGQNFKDMAEDYSKEIFPNVGICEDYLKNLKYEFSEKYQEGFERFQIEMKKMRLLRNVATIQWMKI